MKRDRLTLIKPKSVIRDDITFISNDRFGFNFSDKLNAIKEKVLEESLANIPLVCT